VGSNFNIWTQTIESVSGIEIGSVKLDGTNRTEKKIGAEKRAIAILAVN
jgi:hypothetical protein